MTAGVKYLRTNGPFNTIVLKLRTNHELRQKAGGMRKDVLSKTFVKSMPASYFRLFDKAGKDLGWARDFTMEYGSDVNSDNAVFFGFSQAALVALTTTAGASCGAGCAAATLHQCA